jgi:molecular chaperone DnaK
VRNTTIPTRKSQIFSTAADNQTAVSIHVLQGEREMANQNRTLGRFDLVGIPSAPRGVPQIEVTFDIDANGIVHVSAKDMGTGKEQKIRIESSSGLSEDEINRMVQDAEVHADEDKREREKIEVRNEADSLIYSTEKSLKDYGDKVGEADRKAIQTALDDLKGSLETASTEDLRAKIQTLTQASHKLAEEMYKNTGAGQAAEGGGPEEAAGTAGEQGSAAGGSGNVEDVDYEVVDDDEEKDS